MLTYADRHVYRKSVEIIRNSQKLPGFRKKALLLSFDKSFNINYPAEVSLIY